MTTTRSRTLMSSFKPAGLVLAGAIAGSMFSEMLRPSNAMAQDRPLAPEKVLNSAEQTMRIANGMQQVNEKLTRIESMLNAGIKVKVTEMPASSSKDESR
jgi:hypothetical protein